MLRIHIMLSLWCIMLLHIAVTILCDCHHHLLEINLADFIEVFLITYYIFLCHGLFLKSLTEKYIVSVMKSQSKDDIALKTVTFLSPFSSH